MSQRRQSHERWRRWQASVQVQRVLTPEQQQHGLTVIRVHPSCRDSFLEYAGLINAASHVNEWSPALRQAWQQWLDQTCALRAQCEQAQHHTPQVLA